MTVRESTTGFAEPAFHYIHADRLGSANVVLRANGSTVRSDSFGAFGEPRDAMGNRTGVLHPTAGDADFRTPPVLRRGFTDHEHLDRHALIHMNGRMYDYRLGRFLGGGSNCAVSDQLAVSEPLYLHLEQSVCGHGSDGVCD